MTWFRKAICSFAAACAFLSPLAMTSPVEANPGHAHGRTYHVYYRIGPSQPWVYYGGYHCPNAARTALNAFRARGFDGFIQ